MSISGMISFGPVDFPVDAVLSLAGTSMSISDLTSGLGKGTFSLSTAFKSVCAMGLEDGYVSVMTWARRSGERCFRTDDIERRTRSVNRASNCETARSSKMKFALISSHRCQYSKLQI